MSSSVCTSCLSAILCGEASAPPPREVYHLKHPVLEEKVGERNRDRQEMKDLGDLLHLFACAFLFHFSAFMVIPAITDVTIEALCPGRDQCSLAIYLSGINQAVSSVRRYSFFSSLFRRVTFSLPLYAYR